MKILKISLHITLLILLFTCAESAGSYNALILDCSNKSLIEVPANIADDAKCGKWASACPANDGKQDEKTFNKDKSFYKNALFVRDNYDGEKQTELKVKICDKRFKLSIAMFNKKPLYYEFGFDIYHKPSRTKKCATSDKTKYISLEKTLTKLGSPELLEKRPEMRAMTKADKEMEFLWIPLFRVRYMGGNLERIEYEIRKNNRKPLLQCENFDLGNEVFADIDVDGFYSEDSQKKAFREVDLPENPESQCESGTKCFEKWLLIPADQFRFGPSDPPICSNMTTIPIWSNLVKGILKKVDQYLYTLSRISGVPLRVIAGVHRTLFFQSKRMSLKKYIILKNEKHNLRVPGIIFKLVKFKINNTCKNEEPGCWYGVIMIVHNDPNFTYKSKKICDERTVELGWEEITYENLSTEGDRPNSGDNIYVCAITKSSLEGVGLKYDEKLLISELSLKKFPYYKSATELTYKNVKKRVFEELGKGAEPEFEDDTAIERPFFYDDNFTLDASGVLGELSDESEESKESEDDQADDRNIVDGEEIHNVGLGKENIEVK